MDAADRVTLARWMAAGDVILFTGAGFSMDALNLSGTPVPGARRLGELLWPLAFPGEPHDGASSLSDIFDCAQRAAGTKTRRLLEDALTVSPTGLPESYAQWFSFPWFRIYTLNIDDLDVAAARAFGLPRDIYAFSALSSSLPEAGNKLLSVHLNGRTDDYPDVTFTDRHYGERLARPDAAYQQLVAELTSRPVVYVGTELNEPPLWQHIELRGSKKPRTRELRPRSFLVTPSLPAARRVMLESFNVVHIPMTQAEFAERVLTGMSTEKEVGLTSLRTRVSPLPRGSLLERLADVRSLPGLDLADYLLGRQPHWEDVTRGYAVPRAFEDGLLAEITDAGARVVAITGTAGSGKSTTLMRLALECAAAGQDVRLLTSEDTDLPLSSLKRMIKDSGADVIVIDDADRFGESTGGFLADLVSDKSPRLVLVAMRSTRYERLRVSDKIGTAPLFQITVPHLDDSDIVLLLDALRAAKRLGRLAGMTAVEQAAVFEREAGRQLLVAMIAATSGDRFENKIDSECRDLGGDVGFMYSILAIATSFRQGLDKSEVLAAAGSVGNDGLNFLDGLVRQALVVKDSSGRYLVRHRVIADHAVAYYQRNGQLADPVRGLLFTMATRVRLDGSRRAREWRLVIALLSHETLRRLLGNQTAVREAYTEVESILGADYHFWLQRGSFELEVGDLRLAENFLDQARSIAPDDVMVQTAWAYLRLKRAANEGPGGHSEEWAREAIEELEDAIERRGEKDSYPFHVLGSQGLSWVRRAELPDDERDRVLSRLRAAVKKGCEKHPANLELAQLCDDLDREYLMKAVSDRPVDAVRGAGEDGSPDADHTRS